MILEIIWANIIVPVKNWIVRLCKNPKKIEDTEEDFIPACKSGDVEKVKRLLTQFTPLDLNSGLSEAIQTCQDATAIFLIKQGANNLDENLKIACENNRYSTAELLVQNGARVIVGLRFAKSPNIIKMLHRYEQNSEVIRY